MFSFFKSTPPVQKTEERPQSKPSNEDFKKPTRAYVYVWKGGNKFGHMSVKLPDKYNTPCQKNPDIHAGNYLSFYAAKEANIDSLSFKDKLQGSYPAECHSYEADRRIYGEPDQIYSITIPKPEKMAQNIRQQIENAYEGKKKYSVVGDAIDRNASNCVTSSADALCRGGIRIFTESSDFFGLKYRNNMTPSQLIQSLEKEGKIMQLYKK